MPEALRGIGVSPGLAGRAGRTGWPRRRRCRRRAPVADPAAEAERARRARWRSRRGRPARRGRRRADGAAAEILRAAGDDGRRPRRWRTPSTSRRRGGTDAAARDRRGAFAEHRAAFEAAGGYLAERVADLDDIRDRAVAVCLGPADARRPDARATRSCWSPTTSRPPTPRRSTRPWCSRWSPSDGGPTSHTAILARTLGLPAVVGCAGVARRRGRRRW